MLTSSVVEQTTWNKQDDVITRLSYNDVSFQVFLFLCFLYVTVNATLERLPSLELSDHLRSFRGQ